MSTNRTHGPKGRGIKLKIFKTLLSGGLAVLLSLLAFSHAGAQTCVQPPSGLVSWWPGDGNADDLQDVNDGTLQGGATFAAGMVGQAFSFNGDGFVEAPENGSLDFNGPFTIDLWVSPNPAVSNGSPLVSKYDLTSGDLSNLAYELSLWEVQNGGLLQFGIHCGQTMMVRRTDPGVLPVNVFSHVAVVYRQIPIPVLEIYVNGEPQEGITGGGCTFINENAIPFRIGKRLDGGGAIKLFRGLIDEIEVFNRALSASEIRAIHHAGSVGKCLVRITADGGNHQECTTEGGSNVTFTADGPWLPDGVIIDSVEWFLDGESIDSGETVTAFIALGQHTIEAEATTSEPAIRTGSSSIEIVDTTQPDIVISFSDLSGQPLTSLSRNGLNRVVVDIHATDICDAEPSTTANGGVSITSGEVVEVLPARDQITVGGENFAVTATATDASGNVAHEDAVLPVLD
jgi:hypothetical protein